MTLSGLSIKRKIAMSSFIIMLVMLGLIAYRSISIDNLPRFDIPYVQITTVYPGASPEEIETDVAKRIEDAVASMDGLKRVTSTCMENVGATMLEFDLGTDVDIKIHEVREKLNTIADDFPDTVETPQLSKINMNAVAVVTLFLTGTKTIDELYDYTDETLSDMFSSIPGVGEVRIHGGNEVQLHVTLNREKLAESNLTAAEVVSRIATSNIKLPAGHIKQDGHEMSVTYNAEFADIQALKELEVSSTVGKRIYLGDIAKVELKSKEIRIQSFLNGQEGVEIEIVKRGNANTVKVIDGVRKKYDALVSGGTMPGGMELHWFKDRGEFIHASINDAWNSVLMGIALTALLLFLFLHDLRSTFIVAITMPVSIIITFGAMSLMDYTFDTMTLVSLGCSAGVLVTNSVVVLENIQKKLQEGADAATAAAVGTHEIVNAVAASALTNVVVFAPVATMTSEVGMIIGPFAGVMVIATLASLFVSFTLTPIFASVFFAHGTLSQESRTQKVFRLWDKGYDALTRLFERSMDFTRRHAISVAGVIIIACVISTIFVAPRISMSFFPFNDQRTISISLEYPANTALSTARERTLEIVDELHKRPEVISSVSTVGFTNAIVGRISESVHIGEITLYLCPKNERKDVWSIADELRTTLSKKNDMRSTVNIPLPIGGTSTEVMAYITGPDFKELEKYGNEGMKILRESGIATDIDTSLRTDKPRINILPNRPVLRNLGFSETALGTSVMGFFDGVTAGTYKVGTRTYDIRIKTDELTDFDGVGNLVAGSLHGKPVNLDAVTHLEQDPVSIVMMRQDKQRSVWLFANSSNGASIGDVVKVIKEKLVPQLPRGYNLAFYGEAEMMQSGANDFITVFLIAIMMTYLLIAAIMESWGRPFLVLFTIPLGFVGLMLASWAMNKPLSMITLLGGVMMIGIVVNNAILIMDEVAVLTRNGMLPHDAMPTATKNKFRAIVMISIASVVGMLPMAFGTGVGSELRSSCGVGVVGGLTLSAILTLYLIPALYFVFVKNKMKSTK